MNDAQRKIVEQLLRELDANASEMEMHGLHLAGGAYAEQAAALRALLAQSTPPRPPDFGRCISHPHPCAWPSLCAYHGAWRCRHGWINDGGVTGCPTCAAARADAPKDSDGR